MPAYGTLYIVDHPAVADRLARLRDRETPTAVFRTVLEELGFFLAYEATRALPLRDVEVVTPIEATAVKRFATRPVVAPVLRAGLGLLPGFLRVVEDANIAHLGFYRDPASLLAVPYYANVPEDLADLHVFVLDPMLATGHSGIAALDALAQRGARNVTFISVIAAPEGVRALHEAYPDVRVITAAIDSGLNEHGYIVPGLGDAGDRMFGSLTSVPGTLRTRA